jgi:hydrogenase expression/formation protein HypC
MCIGLPMQVTATRDGFATVTGRGETREVDTALIGPCAVGDWLLVFLDGARERLDPARAAEVNATLDLLATALQDLPCDDQTAAFTLPSAMTPAQLAALTGDTPR